MPDTAKYIPIQSGSITSPKGFFAGAVHAGIKYQQEDRLDLAVLYSEEPCTAAGVFTTNKVKSAPVLLSRERVATGMARAVVVNSGCANASTGDQGLADAREMTAIMSRPLGVPRESVLVASTGVIGTMLPMDKVKDGLDRIALTRLGGQDMARAMMTTDTFPKEAAIAVKAAGQEYVVAGVAKGSGMIHPAMGTMLCFIATDARVERDFLARALKRAAGMSFNMVTVDGDTSPSDTLLALANGAAFAKDRAAISGGPEARAFRTALEMVCTELARSVARDGEGATRLIQVTVEGARSVREARLAARAVAGSTLLKAAVFGADPNWGRAVAALGRSGASLDESKLDVYLGDILVLKGGVPQQFDAGKASKVFKDPEVNIRAALNLGRGKAVAWGCDLTPEYVTINSSYTT